MNFSDIVNELSAKENPKARQLLLIAAMTVSPNALAFPKKIEDITEEILVSSADYLKTEDFNTHFHNICQMDNVPEISLA
jgi:hypothetical protein